MKETNTGTKVFFAALAAYLLFNIDSEGEASPDNPNPMSNDNSLFFPPVDNPQIRSDSEGGGGFGDRRDGGKRKHKGLDIIVFKGQSIYCPFNCYVERNTTVYGKVDPQWKGIVLRGINQFQNVEVKIFYIKPIVLDGAFVARGQYIGDAQAISERFNPNMIDHAHIEIRINSIKGIKDSGQLVDPFNYFFPVV